jgi:NSS family neurotransmitter:Na+ symporter
MCASAQAIARKGDTGTVEKTYWPSRISFVLAAIGSAIGLGNVWRFPYVCYENGGGAFLIAYLVALFTAGIPLMLLEMGLGHKMEAGAPIAFRGTGKGKEWLGWLAVGVGFMIVSYYTVIMAWSLNYFKYSFNLAWGKDTQAFFFNEFLNRSDNLRDVFSFNGPVLAGLAISWALIILCIWKGAQTVGKVVYLTVPLPWICLVIFVIKGLTLPGAEQGIAYYLTPDFAALTKTKVWLAAYTQVFFSLSVGFGVMIAYASFLPRKSDIVNNAFIVSLANCGTSFLGGFAVFGTLGYYAQQMGVEVKDVVSSGIGLAFITYPSIINHLGRAAAFFGAVFFIMLLTLAIDSAFSLVEAAAAGFMDKFNARRLRVNFGVAIAALLAGLIFTTNAGIDWLDIVDHFMNSFGLAVVGMLECIVIGYFYGTKNIREYVNSKSEFSIGKWWDVMIMFVTPVVLAIAIAMEIKDRIFAAYGDPPFPRWAEFAGGWAIVIILPVIAILLMRMKARRAE